MICTSLKDHVTEWLENNNIENCKAVGLGKGHHGVEIIIFKGGLNAEKFIAKYGKSFENKFYKGYLSHWQFDSRIYVSMVKK